MQRSTTSLARTASAAVASGSRSRPIAACKRNSIATAGLRLPARSIRSPLASSSLRQNRSASTLPARGSFARPTVEHVRALRSFLSSENSLLSTLDSTATSSDLKPFNDDWMNKYHGSSSILIKPKSVEEVSAVLKYCNDNNLAVVPQGGNTGLVGGSVPIYDEVILNLANLNEIQKFDEVSGILTVGAGAILETVDGYLAEKGFIFPLDLAAKGSCQVGGNVATNAGGLRLLRYGSLHGNVLGLQVVLPSGEIYDTLGGLRKDNTGFDMKQLFIGSEGTIGIITAITILTPRRPAANNVAVFSLASYEDVQKVFAETKAGLGEILSAFEFFDRASYEMVARVQKAHGQADGRKVFETEGEFYVLIETGGSNTAHDEEKLQALLENLMESSLVLDGVLAESTTQFHSLWSLRELISESAGKAGSTYKYDLSIPVPRMYSLVERMRERLLDSGLLIEGSNEGRVRDVVGYGHIGDGNLHINICCDKYDTAIEEVIEPYIYELVAEEKGSISAEHGLGVMKAPHIHYSQSAVAIEMMKRVKRMYDPKGILNPGKYVL